MIGVASASSTTGCHTPGVVGEFERERFFLADDPELEIGGVGNLRAGDEFGRLAVRALDEHRYGLLPVIRRVWARRGVRVPAPYATKYQWGYLHEALEVDGAHKAELLFTPAIDWDIHALFLKQIADSDPQALHVVSQDQAGFHLPTDDPRRPKNLRLLPLPPYSPELNPVERFGGLLKARVANRLYPSLRKLEDHLFAASRE